MNRTYCMLLAAGLLTGMGSAQAGAEGYERPARDATSTEQMRERPDDGPSRYPDTEIDKGPAARGNKEPPANGSAMDMNDETDNVNDSTLEMPRPR